MIFGVLGAVGLGWRFAWNRGGQKHEKDQKTHPILDPILVIFGYFSGCIFECIFRCPFFPHCERFRGQGLPQREVLGDHFEDFLGVGPRIEN